MKATHGKMFTTGGGGVEGARVFGMLLGILGRTEPVTSQEGSRSNGDMISSLSTVWVSGSSFP